jgi:hypothetical protein
MPLTFKERLAQRALINRAAFIGLYKNEIDKLHELSKEEIDLITPDNTDMEIYAQLIEVVKEASSTNESQAALKEQIVELGEIAVTIAKKIPSLGALL